MIKDVKLTQIRFGVESPFPENGKDINSKLESYTGIFKLGIQTLPGTRFFIDGNPILIGFTGLYELELDGIQIGKIAFDEKSLNLIKENKSYLIVDICYGTVTEESGGE